MTNSLHENDIALSSILALFGLHPFPRVRTLLDQWPMPTYTLTSIPLARYKDSGVPCLKRLDSATRACTGFFHRSTTSPVCILLGPRWSRRRCLGRGCDADKSLDMWAKVFTCMCEKCFLVWKIAEGEMKNGQLIGQMSKFWHRILRSQ